MAKLVEWLDSLKNLSDDARSKLKESIGAAIKDHPEVDTEFEGAILRQSDYSRHMNELKSQKEQLDQEYQSKNQEVERFKQRLVDARGRIDSTYREAIEARNILASRINETNAKIRKLADQEGFSVAELGLEDVKADAPPPNPGADHRPDPNPAETPYITREDLLKETVAVPLFQAQIEDAVAEYYELYGKTIGIGEREKIASKAIRDGRSPKEVAAEMYDFQTKRDERTAQQQKEHDEQIRADERQKVLSDQLAGQARGAHGVSQPNSPALRFSEKHAAQQGGQDISHLLHAANTMEEEAKKLA